MVLSDDKIKFLASGKWETQPCGGSDVSGTWVMIEVSCGIGSESDDADSLPVKRKGHVRAPAVARLPMVTS